jgi:MFS family permease
MGCAGLWTGAMSIVANCVALHQQPTLIGIILGISQLGTTCGPLIGGAITQYATWRWCFYLNLPVGGIAFAYILIISLPDRVSKPPPLSIARMIHHHLDLVGFSLLAPSVILLLLALQWGGNKYAWNSPTVIGLFCGAGAIFFIWLVWNYRLGDTALIPSSMARKQSVWSSSLASMWINLGAILGPLFIPIYFQAIKDTTPFQSGVNILPNVIAQLVAAIISGTLGLLLTPLLPGVWLKRVQ